MPINYDTIRRYIDSLDELSEESRSTKAQLQALLDRCTELDKELAAKPRREDKEEG